MDVLVQYTCTFLRGEGGVIQRVGEFLILVALRVGMQNFEASPLQIVG